MLIKFENKKNAIILGIVSLGHVLLMFFYYVPTPRKKYSQAKNTKFLLKIHSIKKKVKTKKSFSSKTLVKSLTSPIYKWSKLSPTQTILSDKDIKIGVFGERSSQDNIFGKTSSLYYYLQKRIDDKKYYPKELSDHEIEGIVKSRIVFNKMGKFLKKYIKFNSKNDHLNYFARELLNKAFYKKLNQDLSKINTQYIVADVTIHYDRQGQDLSSYTSGNHIYIFIPQTDAHSKPVDNLIISKTFNLGDIYDAIEERVTGSGIARRWHREREFKERKRLSSH